MSDLKTYGENVALIFDISKIYSKRLKSECTKMGIKNAYRLLLSALLDHNGATQLELVEATQLKTPTVSITLRKMEKEGYVVRQADEDDLRKNHVFLTEAGRVLNSEISKKLLGIESEMLVGLSENEIKNLSSYLKMIKDNLYK